MPGHGSLPAEDKGNHPGRQVGRGWQNATPDELDAMGLSVSGMHARYGLSLALSGKGRAMMQSQPAASSDPRSQASKDAHARIEASMKSRKAAGTSRAAMDADTIEDYRRNRKDYED